MNDPVPTVLLSPVDFVEPTPQVGPDGRVRTPSIRLVTDVSGAVTTGLVAGAIVQELPEGPHLVARVGLGVTSVGAAEEALLRLALQLAPRGLFATVVNDCQEAVTRVMRDLVSAAQGRGVAGPEMAGVSPSQPLARQVVWEPRRSTPASVLADDQAAVALAEYEAQMLERLRELREAHGHPAARLSVIDTELPGGGGRVIAAAARFLRATGTLERIDIRVRPATQSGLKSLATLVEDLGLQEAAMSMQLAVQVHTGGALFGETPRSELQRLLRVQMQQDALPRHQLQMLLGAVAESVELTGLVRHMELASDPGMCLMSGPPVESNPTAPGGAREHMLTTSLLMGERRPSRLSELLLDPLATFTQVRVRSIQPLLDAIGVQTHPGGERALQVRVERVGPHVSDRPLVLRLFAPIGSGVVMPDSGAHVTQADLRHLVSQIMRAPICEGPAAERIRTSQLPYMAHGYEDLDAEQRPELDSPEAGVISMHPAAQQAGLYPAPVFLPRAMLQLPAPALLEPRIRAAQA